MSNPQRTGVAFLAAKISLNDDILLIKPRTQPLKVNSNTFLMAVIRVETSGHKPVDFSEEQLQSLIAKIIDLLSIKPVQAFCKSISMLDNPSARFIADFCWGLRERMPLSMPISMTALASWCLRDSWTKDLPCNEIVPMFFSMGRDRKRMLSLLKSGDGCARTSLTNSIGLSVDEPDVITALPSGQ